MLENAFKSDRLACPAIGLPPWTRPGISKTARKLCLLTLCSLLLIACGSPQRSSRLGLPQEPAKATPQLAAGLLNQGDTAQAAHVYAQLASQQANHELAQQYQLLATELYFDSERYSDALIAYEQLDTEPTTESQQRYEVLQAYLELARAQPAQALEILPQPRNLNQRVLRIRALEIQARAASQLGDPMQALKTRILIEANLTKAQAITHNRQVTRDMLAALDSTQLQKMAQIPAGSVYRGWVEYMLLRRAADSNTNYELISQRTKSWNSRFPGHPAAIRENNHPSDTALTAASAISTDRIALLLPLSGDLAEVGKTIKSGFLAARYRSKPASAAEVKIFDTGSTVSKTISQYETAVAEGASLIVGPLNKAAVIKLATTNRITVPTLSLNYTSDDVTPNPNLYQFGLLPEDEARDAAAWVREQNLKNALVVTTDNQLGDRLANAFTETLEEKGGRVLSVQKIPHGSYDYSSQLKKLLAINESNARKRQLQKTLDTKVEFEPSIRGDIDIIFMAVGADQARLLRPQLQFHHATDIPLVSTATIFSGTVDKRADGDLSGVVFCETPWLLDDVQPKSKLFRELRAVEPDTASSLYKLQALGIDAWNLHAALEKMRFDPLHTVAGKTGALTLAAGNRIRRRLSWAEFQAGEPVKIGQPLPIETTFPVMITDM